MAKLNLWNIRNKDLALDSIESAISYLNERRKTLYDVPAQAIILLLDKFSNVVRFEKHKNFSRIVE